MPVTTAFRFLAGDHQQYVGIWKFQRAIRLLTEGVIQANLTAAEFGPSLVLTLHIQVVATSEQKLLACLSIGRTV